MKMSMYLLNCKYIFTSFINEKSLQTIVFRERFVLNVSNWVNYESINSKPEVTCNRQKFYVWSCENEKGMLLPLLNAPTFLRRIGNLTR